MSLQGQRLPDGPCGLASAGIVRRRRGSERTLNPSKAGEEGSSFVTPRSTDPLRWVHQPAGLLGQHRVPGALPLRFLPALSLGPPMREKPQAWKFCLGALSSPGERVLLEVLRDLLGQSWGEVAAEDELCFLLSPQQLGAAHSQPKECAPLAPASPGHGNSLWGARCFHNMFQK